MRVITGSARGRRLLELAGGETRPTADRVKEGVFNIIQFDIEGRRVLDLFAGTGQLGVEALSRGAAEAVFVEQRRDAARLVTENLKLTGLADRLWESAISAIYRFDILSNHGIIVCESPVDQEMPAVKAPLFLHRTYRYGRIRITTYHREEGREA